MDRRLITDLKKRRDNRLNAVREKIKYFYDNAKENKELDVINLIKKSIKLLESNLKHEIIGFESETYNCDYLNISNEQKNNFTEEIIENIREGVEISIENSLKEIKQDLSMRFLDSSLDYVNEADKDKYINAVKLLVRLEKIKQVDELENNLNEISKDLISCIDYNNKIEAELGKVD